MPTLFYLKRERFLHYRLLQVINTLIFKTVYAEETSKVLRTANSLLYGGCIQKGFRQPVVTFLTFSVTIVYLFLVGCVLFIQKAI